MELSILSIVLLLSSMNGVVFSLFAGTKICKDQINIYISILLGLCGLIFFDEFTRWTPAYFLNYPGSVFIFTSAWFLLLPIIFLMIRYQVKGIIFRGYDLAHLITCILALHVGDYFVSDEFTISYLLNLQDSVEPHDGKFIFSAQIIIYVTMILRLLAREYKMSILHLIPRLSGWLQSILIVLLVYLLTMWIYIIGDVWFGLHLNVLDTWKTNIFLFFIYGWLFAADQPSVFKYSIRSERIIEKKLKKRDLSKELLTIIDEIQTSGVFLDKAITTGKLAKTIGISGRRLTNLVNEELHISVNQLLNILRIGEMELRYHKQEFKKYSLEGLALSVGFNSKSSFYRNFKLFKGISPVTHFNMLSPEYLER